jgi:TolB-like protein/DNA-binding winged helix-turn-helix (wHTH) protein/Tfp pilus assembly protein PilF
MIEDGATQLSETSSPMAGRFRVGEFLVDPSALRVRRDGEDARLEAKVMQVLVYLAQNAGRVVSRTELEQQVWPGRVVTEDSVTAAIAKLRRALADDAHAPRVIETIPKSGYRLIADVAPVSGNGDGSIPVPASALSRKRLGRRSAALWAAALLTTLLLAAGTWRLLQPNQVSPARSGPLSDRPAVAVLPFANLGAAPEQDYFANGITADLITDLSKLQALLVIAPGSVFAYDSGQAAARQIARDMQLDYVVVGSVQRIGSRLRINVQLVEAPGERAVWGRRYTAEMNDLFGLQDRISAAVIAALKVKLSPAEQVLLADRPTANVLAYDHYLRGMQDHGTRSLEQNRLARDHFRQAIELDPGFARAYAGLALTYCRDAIDGWTARPRHALQLAAELADRAMDMEPASPQVHFAAGQVALFRQRHAEAIAAADRAIEVEPNYADAHALKAWTLNYAGDSGAALSALEQATRLSPRPPASYLEILGEIQFTQGNDEASASTFQRVLEVNPGYSRARMWNAAALASAGQTDRAEWEIDELLITSPELTRRRLEFAFPYKEAGALDRLLKALRIAGLPD